MLRRAALCVLCCVQTEELGAKMLDIAGLAGKAAARERNEEKLGRQIAKLEEGE